MILYYGLIETVVVETSSTITNSIRTKAKITQASLEILCRQLVFSFACLLRFTPSRNQPTSNHDNPHPSTGTSLFRGQGICRFCSRCWPCGPG